MREARPTRLRGVIAAIDTPVDAEGSPDSQSFAKIADHLLSNGCDALNVLGTTGEATSFTVEQRARLMNSIAARGLPLDRMMVGTGAAAVGDAVALTRLAGELGFAGALILPPFYYKGVGDTGIVRYFTAIVQATKSAPAPIYLYNFPAQSGVPYEPSLVARLRSEFGGRIVGLKDSSGNLDYAKQVAALEGGALDVFPSSEAVLLEARAGAFAGCISATANVNSALCQLALSSGDQQALDTAVAIRKLFDGKQLVSGVKAVMARILGDPRIAEVLPPLQRWASVDEQALVGRYEQLISSARTPSKVA
jgi:4-hydroxy-tetrahydrodipicolinate synthase